jgi:hypothetical protein
MTALEFLKSEGLPTGVLLHENGSLWSINYFAKLMEQYATLKDDGSKPLQKKILVNDISPYYYGKKILVILMKAKPIGIEKDVIYRAVYGTRYKCNDDLSPTIQIGNVIISPNEIIGFKEIENPSEQDVFNYINGLFNPNDMEKVNTKIYYAD